MGSSQYRFGSKEWETHMRRSLAQRKRHGEDIKDIDGLIAYIKAKGPAEGDKVGEKKIKHKSRRNSKRSNKRSTIGRDTIRQKSSQVSQAQAKPKEIQIVGDGLYSAPNILKVR